MLFAASAGYTGGLEPGLSKASSLPRVRGLSTGPKSSAQLGVDCCVDDYVGSQQLAAANISLRISESS